MNRLPISVLTLVAANACASATINFGTGSQSWIATSNYQDFGFKYDATAGYWYTDHVDGLYTTLTSPTTVNIGPSYTIGLWQTFTTEANYDYGFVQYSLDGQNWNNFLLRGNVGMSGNPSDGPVGQFYMEITGAAEPMAPVYLRLVFQTDGSDYSGSQSIQWAINGITGSPVPEPSTYGLALGGLALAVVAARRARKTKA